jgi:alpha-1,2-mannosyltransferase
MVRRTLPWAVPGAVGVVLLAAAIVGAVAGDLTDLHVYRYAGDLLLRGEPLYESRDPVEGLRFTYPPFAAVLLTPLTLMPGWLAAALLTGVSAACLAASVVVVRRAYGRPAPGWLVLLVGVAAVALEPVWQNLVFGQVNTVLMLLVLVDLTQPGRRWTGVLVGVAAGVKLTPLVFVVLLLLAGRRSAAGRALAVFAGTVAVGFVVAPGSSASYWTERLFDATRVGPPALAHNQSAYGALTRLTGAPPPTVVGLLVGAGLAVAVLLVAAAWWRRGDPVLATCLGAVAMLMASPVSWSHHWVWAVPTALAVWEHSRWVAVAWTGVFVARPMLWPPWGSGREYAWGPAEHLVGNAYLLAGLALVAWAAAVVHRVAGPPGG